MEALVTIIAVGAYAEAHTLSASIRSRTAALNTSRAVA